VYQVWSKGASMKILVGIVAVILAITSLILLVAMFVEGLVNKDDL
jgi:hypothetical protein